MNRLVELWRSIPFLTDGTSRRTVLSCMLVCGVLATGYAFLNPGNWTAGLSLVVRDDLLGESFKPGRFNSPESMKSAQETIFHIARSPDVIRSALKGAGIDSSSLGTSDIEAYQNSITIIAPNGAEFGKTEVFVLKASQKTKDNAKLFVESIATEIEARLRTLRTSMLESMQSELALNLVQAGKHYQELADQVRELELTVGSDLSALRSLVDSNGGKSDLQNSLEQIRTELRGAENERDRVRKQLDLIQLAQTQTQSQFLTTSNELLELQPVLRRLSDGLVDARLSLSKSLGMYDSGHPAIEIAQTAVDQTLNQIRSELESTERGLSSQLDMYQLKLDRLTAEESKYINRLISVAKLRVEYQTLNNELAKRGEALSKLRTNSAEIQAMAESSDGISLITRIGEPQLGTRRSGLSTKAMLLAGLIGGLLIGMGWVVLNHDPDKNLFAQATITAKQSQENKQNNSQSQSINQPQPSAPTQNAAKESPQQWTPNVAVETVPQQISAEAQPVKPNVKPVVLKSLGPETTAKAETPKANASKIPQKTSSEATGKTPSAAPPTEPEAKPRNAESISPPTTTDNPKVPAAPQQPTQRPGMMVSMPGGRPGQVLKTSDLVSQRPARERDSQAANSNKESLNNSTELISSNVPQKATEKVTSETTASDRKTTQSRVEKTVMLTEENPSKPNTISNDRLSDSTINLADKQIESIRKQLAEIDPTTSFDVFCNSIKKPEAE